LDGAGEAASVGVAELPKKENDDTSSIFFQSPLAGFMASFRLGLTVIKRYFDTSGASL